MQSLVIMFLQSIPFGQSLLPPLTSAVYTKSSQNNAAIVSSFFPEIIREIAPFPLLELLSIFFNRKQIRYFTPEALP